MKVTLTRILVGAALLLSPLVISPIPAALAQDGDAPASQPHPQVMGRMQPGFANPNSDRAQALGNRLQQLPFTVGGSERNPAQDFGLQDPTSPHARLKQEIRQLRVQPGGASRVPPEALDFGELPGIGQGQFGQGQPGQGQQGGQLSGISGVGGFVEGSFNDFTPPLTIEESIMEGVGEMARGIGLFHRHTGAGHLYHSRARLINQEALEEAIENDVKATIGYFYERELNRRLRGLERGPIPTPESIDRYSRYRVPDRLTEPELNPAIGSINWPAVLRRPEFNEHRERLNELFYERTYYNSGIASETYPQIQEATRQMLTTLQEQVRETDPTAYMVARNFIDSLAYEARFVSEPESPSDEVAARPGMIR